MKGSTVENSTTNTPAGESWTLYVFYTPQALVQENFISVSFLPTGEIDFTKTNESYLSHANALLAPTISALQDLFNNPSLDIWQLFNWMIVSIYWILLADFGQIAPTTYPYSQSPAWEGYPDFNIPTEYPPTNNIFYNETLFDRFGEYLLENILPFFESQYNISVPLTSFSQGSQTKIQPIPMTFVRSYYCSQLQLKGWVSLLVAVIVADYALLTTTYTFLIWVARRLEARRIIIEDEGIDIAPYWTND